MAQVGPEAVQVWVEFCESRSLWRSSFLEAIGRWIEAHPDSPIVQQWVADARADMAEKNRGRRG